MTTFRLPGNSLRSAPVGTRFPASVHAITCSIPTMRDVIGYEEKDPETMSQITSGYPRFVTHFFIRRIADHWREKYRLGTDEVFVVASETAAREAAGFSGVEVGTIEDGGLLGLHLPPGPAAARVKAYLQHTGGGISSRRAETYLLERGMLAGAQQEERAEAGAAGAEIRRKVASLFGAAEGGVLLGSSGMNAFYAIFRAISAIQQPRGRRDWIQLGWLYVDTIEVLRKLGGGRHHVLHNVLDLDPLERLLREEGRQVAGIVTEVPTNPLMQTPDLERLRALATQHDIPLVVDPTLASPFNIDVLPLCDVAVNSLTKYAAAAGDVMMGAAVFSPASSLAAEVREKAKAWLTLPFPGDLQRLAVEIRNYERVMQRINANTLAVTRFLEQHPAVEKVCGAYSGASGKNYARLERRPGSPGGIVTIKLRQALADFFDRVEVPKGPSFGTTFTILCPFLYLAHYDLVTSEEGRRQLRQAELDPDLLRISIGTEEANEIIAAFEAALS